MTRVTDREAAVFAAYDEQDAATVWYRADTKLLVTESADSRNDEFIWLRDLALDLTDERWSHAETQAAFAECVRALDAVRVWFNEAVEVNARDGFDFEVEFNREFPFGDLNESLSTPRAVAVLRGTP
jgi:hypothetical protein